MTEAVAPSAAARRRQTSLVATAGIAVVFLVVSIVFAADTQCRQAVQLTLRL